MVYPRSGLTSGGKDVKILLLGSKGVGKTALVVRFLTKRFIGDYDRTSDQMYKYKTAIGGKHSTFHIYDSCGDCMAAGRAPDDDPDDGGRFEQLVTWADVILLLFSLVEPESFAKADECRKRIGERQRQQSDDDAAAAAVLVVGTKADLIDGRRMQTERLIECADNRKLAVHRSSARESFDSVLAVFQQAYKEAAGRSCRSPTRKLKALFQSTLRRSYLARGSPADAPPEKLIGAPAAAEDGASPARRERRRGDGKGKPGGSEAATADYRVRTFTL